MAQSSKITLNEDGVTFLTPLTADDDVTSTQTVVVDTDPGSQVINFDKLGISFTYTGDVDTAAFATQTITTEPTAGGGNFRIGLGTDADSGGV